MCHFVRLVYIQIPRSVKLLYRYEKEHTGQALVVEYMRQYSSPTTGCRHAAHSLLKRETLELKWGPGELGRIKLYWYLQEAWRYKHCKFNVCTGSSQNTCTILKQLTRYDNTDLLHSVDWLEQRLQVQYNHEICNLPNLYHQYNKKVQMKLSAYMHNVALTPLATRF